MCIFAQYVWMCTVRDVSCRQPSKFPALRCSEFIPRCCVLKIHYYCQAGSENNKSNRFLKLWHPCARRHRNRFLKLCVRRDRNRFLKLWHPCVRRYRNRFLKLWHPCVRRHRNKFLKLWHPCVRRHRNRFLKNMHRGIRTTPRPPDHRKETQTALVWSCLPFIRFGQNNLAMHSERGKKTGRQKNRWEDNIRKWTGLEFAKS